MLIADDIKILYFKRWTAQNVKILRVISVLTSANNKNTESYLREYVKELERIKNEEKQQLNEGLSYNS